MIPCNLKEVEVAKYSENYVRMVNYRKCLLSNSSYLAQHIRS